MRQFIFCHQNVNDTNLELIINTIPTDKPIDYLNFSQNYITDLGVPFLCKFITTHRVIKLNLNFNMISDHGAELLSIALQNSDVEFLYLCGNHIGDHGIFHLVYCFQYTPLLIVDLSRNKFGDAGYQHIIRALKNKSLIWNIILDIPFKYIKHTSQLEECIKLNQKKYFNL